MAEQYKFKNQEIVELGTVEGDVELQNCGYVQPKEGREIVVTGDIRVKGEIVFDGSLRCRSLKGKTTDRITIEGDLTVETIASSRGSLYVRGSAKGREFDAGGSLKIEMDLECESAKGGGSLVVRGNAKGQRLFGGGSIKVEGDAEVSRVRGGGSVKIQGRADIDELEAGGSGKVNNGRVSKVDVGGSFKTEGAVEVEEIDVGGSVSVATGSKVESVDVGGTFKSGDNLDFGTIDVGGTVKINGEAKGRRIDVGGTLKTDGPLTVSEGLEVGGTVIVGGNLQCEKKIKVGGTIRVYGRIDTFRIIVGGSIDADYIKATDGFRIGRRADVTGFVESPEILIRERARTASLYGDDIRIEERARVRNVYGKRIYIERGAVIEGETLYTESLDAEEDVNFKSEPRKVDSLPPPDQLK